MSGFNVFLHQEFLRRQAKNKSYSRRAFARDLGISPGFLSQLFSGQKNLSADKASIILDHVDWSKSKKSTFLNLVRLSAAKEESLKEKIKGDLSGQRQSLVDYKEVKLDVFRVISNWYYHGFIALIKTDNFRSDINWIAKRLGLKVERIKEVIEVLKNLQLIRNNAGKWEPQYEMIRTHRVPSGAIREHHRQFLEKAIVALRNQASDEIDFSGSTIAIDKKKLPLAQKLIKEFREQIAEVLADPDHTDEVYRLSVQLFRISEPVGTSIQKNQSIEKKLR
jgi:uncharacterized protein (TIGR02147 family)